MDVRPAKTDPVHAGADLAESGGAGVGDFDEGQLVGGGEQERAHAASQSPKTDGEKGKVGREQVTFG